MFQLCYFKFSLTPDDRDVKRRTSLSSFYCSLHLQAQKQKPMKALLLMHSVFNVTRRLPHIIGIPTPLWFVWYSHPSAYIYPCDSFLRDRDKTVEYTHWRCWRLQALPAFDTTRIMWILFPELSFIMCLAGRDYIGPGGDWPADLHV